MKTFVTEFAVRGYELDGYGHVNNAVYLNYAEHARWCMIEEATGGSDYFQKNNCAPVVARVEVDYKAPCYLADWLRVETTMIEVRKKVVVFEHKVLRKASATREAALAAVIRATLVAVGESGRAQSLPSDFADVFGGAPVV